MKGYLIFLLLFLGLAILYQAYVSRLVYQNYSDNQRILQLLMIWLIPGIGAFLCHWFVNDSRAEESITNEGQDSTDSSSRECGRETENVNGDGD